MSRKIQMADVVRAHIEVRGCPVLTGNQCHAIAMNLNFQIGSTPAYDEAKERELFEAYASKHYRLQELPLDFDDGEYTEPETQYSWESWEACAKSRARSAE